MYTKLLWIKVSEKCGNVTYCIIVSKALFSLLYYEWKCHTYKFNLNLIYIHTQLYINVTTLYLISVKYKIFKK